MARSGLSKLARLIENTKVEVNEEFLHDLKKSMEIQCAKDTRMPSKTYKPSSMKCIRNMYFQVTGAQIDDEPQSYCMIGICNAGSDIHIRVQQYIESMKANGFDCEYIDVADYIRSREITDIEVVDKCGMETKLYHKKLNVSFMCDGIIRYNGQYYILEIKSEMGMKWNARTGVDPTHYMQGTAYSELLGIHSVMFLYVSRDVLDMKAYLFTPTQEMRGEFIKKIADCNEYAKMQVAPPKPENIDKRVCNYCGYKTVCKKTF